MIRALLLLLVCGWMLTACSTQRVVCPAYQSAFIFDKPTQKETFVYFNENKNQPREVLASNSRKLTLPANDSSWSSSVVLPGPALPKEKRVKKDRYLLLPEKTYRKALRALQTVPMKPVYPKKADSVDIKALLDSAARSISDSTLIVPKDSTTAAAAEDSVYVISKEKEKFTSDQDNYMWYFRNILVLPDVRAAMQEERESKKETAKKEAKKEKKGFFRSILDIFKRKPKPVPTDTVPATTISEDDKLLAGPETEPDTTEVATVPVKKDSSQIKKTKAPKKSLLKKKAPAVDKKVPEKKKDPAKKEEDDGFED